MQINLTNIEKSDIKIQRLLKIMKLGIPKPVASGTWQTFDSLSHVIEEAYEAVMLHEGNINNIQEELGDLYSSGFLSQIAEERNYFTFLDVVETISEKMITRHPHIFSDNKEFRTAQEQKESWEKIKQVEQEEKFCKRKSLLTNITKNLPPLVKSKKNPRQGK